MNDKRNGWRYRLGLPFFIVHCTLFIFHCSLSLSQVPTREQLVGTWIGVHTEWDIDTYCPLPTYIRLDVDSTYHLGIIDGSAKEQISTWAIHGETMRLDTIHFAPRLVSLQENLLRIGTNYPMVFRRFNDVAIDSVSAYQELSGRVWQSDSLVIYLYANGRAALENPLTKQRTAHFWRLARFNQSVFLLIRGNQYNQDGGYRPLWQISSLSRKQIQAIGWNGHSVSTETFRFIRNLSSADTCHPSGFQICDNCFARMWHYTSVEREEIHTLRQLFHTYYQSEKRPGQSGLIRIRFVINCQGERGLFDVAGFGDDYCPRTFATQITDQLVKICRQYVPADLSGFVSDLPNMQSQDSAVSLTFRLKDGQITDILP